MVMSDLFLGAPSPPEIAVAHCNFHLRGAASDADAALVRGWAERNGVRFFLADFNTRKYAAFRRMSIEMTARELRYTWFARVCRQHGYAAVAVAHNRNDNAETLVLNLLRGTGIRGMAGMRPVSVVPGSAGTGEAVPLLRPLLGFSRKDIQEYALSRGVEWREDSTNAGSACKRNCIRNEIFPLFEKLNPSFLDALSRDMENLRQVQGIAEDYVAAAFPRVAEQTENGAGMTIGIRELKAVKHWEYVLRTLLAPYSFTPSDISDLCRLLREGETVSGKTFRAEGHSLVTTPTGLVVGRAGRSGVPAEELSVEGPGEYSCNGVKFAVSVENFRPGMPLKPPPGSLLFDGAALPFPFTVRGWREGDWMHPLGLRTSSGKPARKKLSDLFTDLKTGLPGKEKALVVSGEGSHVLALLGCRIDDSVRVTDTTASLTRIRLKLPI